MIKIGIPRALLYHKYNVLWREFFNQLGCSVVVSPETNREIVAHGLTLAVDESCLSVKIYLGHVDYLKERVDYIFIPRYVTLHKGENLCVKFMALNDIVRNTFTNLKILEYTVSVNSFRYEVFGLMRLGWKLTHKPLLTWRAYTKARRKYELDTAQKLAEQLEKIKTHNLSEPTILVVSHPYTTYDSILGKPIIKFLEGQGINLIYSDIVDSSTARDLSRKLSEDLYWTYNKELLGAIEFYRSHIDGIIFLMTFPCGPDSLVINLCQNKIKDIPLAVITLDELQAEAGLKTRLESFVDILKIKKTKNERAK